MTAKERFEQALTPGKPVTADQFLNSIRFLDNQINALDLARARLADQRQNILDRAQSLGANLTGISVQQSRSSKTENLGIELADLPPIQNLLQKLNEYQALINSKIDMLVDRKREALTAIVRIEEPRHGALLVYRFIDGLKWSTIADLMGYAEGHARGILKDEAVAAFERVWRPGEKILQNNTHIS